MSAAAFEPIVGRYLNVELLDRPHRVYVEEAGAGTPLLCLHTAGSDTRQWRGLLNDPNVIDRFRVVAFDLPWHGKSSPPTGWHDEEYSLSADDYTSMILDVAKALELDRPIVIGCSIGGRMVLHLGLEHPDLVGALIGLQAGAHTDPYYDLDWLHRPDVHGGEVCAAIVSGLIGPDAPEADRWETLWHYMQGGPGVFKGDLDFYTVGGDLRGRLGNIPAQCPLFLLSGEFDYSCTPEDTLEVAKAVPHAQAKVMPGLGHFPMSEDYATFRTHLLPVLDAAAAARTDRNGASNDATG
jgi:pimeloyl-ACP methyl ester carboxylesterase